MSRVWDNQGRVADLTLELHGPAQSAFVYRPERNIEKMGISIAPELVGAVLGVKCGDIPPHDQNAPVEFIEADYSQTLSLAQRGAKSNDVIDALLIDLNREAGSAAQKEPDLIRALTLARSRDRFLSIQDWATAAELSERQFRRRFLDFVGCSPVTYKKILRIQRVLSEVDMSDKVDWADLANKHGFFDQSHMIRDFSSMLGAAPSVVQLERKLGVTDFSNRKIAVFPS